MIAKVRAETASDFLDSSGHVNQCLRRRGIRGNTLFPICIAAAVYFVYVGPMRYQVTLKEFLLRRLNMNPRYSLRAFASSLGLEPSKLSEALSGKKGLSSERAEKVCDMVSSSAFSPSHGQ